MAGGEFEGGEERNNLSNTFEEATTLI